jgi:hypothetical protein
VYTVTKSQMTNAPGRIVAVPLGDGTCGYGRVITEPQCSFFDVRGACDEPVDPLWLVEQPVAFTIAVMKSAFRRAGPWTLLDVVPPLEEELSVAFRQGKRDAISGRFSVYWEDPASGTWGEEPAQRHEVIDLEVAAVWSREHVEDRLRDHFAGKPNTWVELLKRGW